MNPKQPSLRNQSSCKKLLCSIGHRRVFSLPVLKSAWKQVKSVDKHRRVGSVFYLKAIQPIRQFTESSKTSFKSKARAVQNPAIVFAPKVFENQFFRDKYTADGEYERVLESIEESGDLPLYESEVHMKGFERVEAAEDINLHIQVPDNSVLVSSENVRKRKMCLHEQLCQKLVQVMRELDTSSSQFQNQPQDLFARLQVQRHAATGNKRVVFNER